ncbi:hypothetical protein MMC09_003583 [Bachmanniomyces sp. S44760]|nr:hypothetical protein [Bachmanniomyces sp. S44760]
MSSTGILFSQTLQDITNTKLDEVALKRESFEKKSQDVVVNLSSQEDPIQRVRSLVEGVKSCFNVSTYRGRVLMGGTNNRRLEYDLRHLDRFLAQARYDPSVSSKILEQWEQSMLRHIEVQSLKYSYANLYGKLTSEWLSSTQKAATVIEGEDAESQDFEKVDGGNKMESRVNWERSVFEPAKVDKSGVDSMLKAMFEPESDGSKRLPRALKDLRDGVEAFEQQLARPRIFDSYTLDWTINGLLDSDLLTDEKRNVLKEFQGNNVVMNEIADVLNMRLAALQTWSWGSEVPLEQRRQMNGTYKIYMHEELLQAIFLQFIGVKWSVLWKQTFSDFRKYRGVWKLPRESVSLLDMKRREYFLGHMSERPNVESKKQRIYRRDYFMARLLDYETQQRTGEEGDEEADLDTDVTPKRSKQTARKSTACQQLSSSISCAPQSSMVSQSKRRSTGGAYRHRITEKHYVDDENLDDVDSEFDDEDDNDEARNPMEAKQSLLHLLSTEIAIKCRLHGEITCFRSQIEDLYPSLPHDTIECVLKFFGVSQKWLKFFRTFLQAPLKFIDDEFAEPRLRMRGTPGAHALSDVFGEVVLFCLDFKVNQDAAGELLWRLHDDFWFWSARDEACVKAWTTIDKFNKTMGLTLSESRSGSVRMLQRTKTDKKIVVEVKDPLPKGDIRWGMLRLNPEIGRFEIDQQIVDKHILELSRQLQSKTTSVFSWIQAWNSYAATFFTSNFGKVANCFGREHVDNMLATHNRIQRQVFSSSADATGLGPGSSAGEGSIIEYLKETISQRFGITDIPDGYFFFPTCLGGLEVRNPFVGLLQIRDTVLEHPSELLDKFEEAEREAYKNAKTRFEQGKTRHDELLDPNFRPADYKTFFPFAEYTKYREELNYGFSDQLGDVFKKLLQRPAEEKFEEHEGVIKRAVDVLSSGGEIGPSWGNMKPYWQWVAQLYGPGMIERFGGFSVVDPGLLPMGMVGLFRSGRVKWQE